MMHTSTRCVPPVTNKIDKVVTNPINVVKPEVAQVKPEAKKTVEAKTPQTVEPEKATVQQKKIEIVESENIKPVIDINTFIAELANKDYARQAEAMGTIAQVASVSPDIAAQLLDVKVIDTLLGIMHADTTKLQMPSEKQMMLRQSALKGHTLSVEDMKEATSMSEYELAEQNKQYAMYTLASLQRVYAGEVKKMGAEVAFSDLPGANEILKEIESNPNPAVRISGLSALNYVQRPEYKAEIHAAYEKASQDKNPLVRDVAQRGAQLLA